MTAMISVYRSDFPPFIRDRIYWGFVDMEPLREFWMGGPMPLALPRQAISIRRYQFAQLSGLPKETPSE